MLPDDLRSCGWQRHTLWGRKRWQGGSHNALPPERFPAICATMSGCSSYWTLFVEGGPGTRLVWKCVGRGNPLLPNPPLNHQFLEAAANFTLEDHDAFHVVLFSTCSSVSFCDFFSVGSFRDDHQKPWSEGQWLRGSSRWEVYHCLLCTQLLVSEFYTVHMK